MYLVMHFACDLFYGPFGPLSRFIVARFKVKGFVVGGSSTCG